MPSKVVVTVGVTVLGVIVSVVIGVTVAELHAGPVISPIATSGPFTPTRTVPGIRVPESTMLNSPL
jgi:hypothetical protein